MNPSDNAQCSVSSMQLHWMMVVNIILKIPNWFSVLHNVGCFRDTGHESNSEWNQSGRDTIRFPGQLHIKVTEDRE